jgi:hypothetical protein
MDNSYLCHIDIEKFITYEKSSLSPFFDLESYVETKKKWKDDRKYEDSELKEEELNYLIPIWNTTSPILFMILGDWLRQWIYYIFV